MPSNGHENCLDKSLYAQKLTNLVFCPHLSDDVTLMPKYGHKSSETASIPNFFVISIQKMTLNNCSYLLPQKLPPTPMHRLVYVNKLSKLRANTEAAAHGCSVAVFKKSETAVSRCSSRGC